MLHLWLTIPFFFFSFFRHASSYSWSFTSQPLQCQNVSIAVQGSGQPPYSLFLLPTGPAPIQKFPEFRQYQTIPFTGSSTTLTFNLNYPENSSFVAVVCLYRRCPPLLESLAYRLAHPHRSVTAVGLEPVVPVPQLQSFHHPTRVVIVPPRAAGSLGDLTSIPRTVSYNVNRFGGGGIKILSSGAFSIRPQSAYANTISDGFIHLVAYSTAKFYGVIPGGDSFIIPQGPLSETNVTGTGFSWTVNIFSETYFIIVGGDDRGIAAGGASGYIIGYSADGSCLSSTSPSSTAGSPAGGSYPTGTNGSPSGSSMQS